MICALTDFPGHISDMENGKTRIQLYQIAAIKTVLNIDLNDLIPEYTHKTLTIDELMERKSQIKKEKQAHQRKKPKLVHFFVPDFINI